MGLILNTRLKITGHTLVFRSLILAIACTLISACDQVSPPKENKNVEVKFKLNGESLLSAANLYAYSQLSETLNKAQELEGLITAFLHQPNPGSLEETQKAWVDTYHSYLTVDFFYSIPRFEKPQHHEDGDTYKILHEQLDSWPIEAGYVDYLPLYPLSGIINDLTLKMSTQDIISQHGFSDQRFASIGFHPMEFLLFGLNGQRSAKDFIPQENRFEIVDIDNKTHAASNTQTSKTARENTEEKGELANEANHSHANDIGLEPQNHNRRREFLRLLSTILVKDLRKLVDRWEPARGYYAKQWRQPQRAKNVQQIYQVSLNTLQEELLNKHFHPLLNEVELEDLRSPFSSNDSANILAILQGINGLFHVENGFIAELQYRQPEIAKEISSQFNQLITETQGFPSNLTKRPLDKRIKIISPAQQNLMKLLESLYAGAEVLGLPLAALPVSTH